MDFENLCGWLFIYLPYAGINVFSPALVLIGFCVGIISAFLGIGGAWLVTPALNILGFPMTFAIGTDIAHIGAKGILATIYHAKRKHVDFALAACMVIGTIVGIELGAQTIMFLEKTQNVESILRWVYIVVLTCFSCFIFIENRRKITFYEKILLLPFPPFVHFRTSNIYCSVWIPIFIGLISGFAAGFLGIGGGLIHWTCANPVL